jgi:hypothetical protein
MPQIVLTPAATARKSEAGQLDEVRENRAAQLMRAGLADGKAMGETGNADLSLSMILVFVMLINFVLGLLGAGVYSACAHWIGGPGGILARRACAAEAEDLENSRRLLREAGLISTPPCDATVDRPTEEEIEADDDDLSVGDADYEDKTVLLKDEGQEPDGHLVTGAAAEQEEPKTFENPDTEDLIKKLQTG